MGGGNPGQKLVIRGKGAVFKGDYSGGWVSMDVYMYPRNDIMSIYKLTYLIIWYIYRYTTLKIT
jgi:hypothetical protein